MASPADETARGDVGLAAAEHLDQCARQVRKRNRRRPSRRGHDLTPPERDKYRTRRAARRSEQDVVARSTQFISPCRVSDADRVEETFEDVVLVE